MSLKDSNTDLPTVAGSWALTIQGALAGTVSVAAGVSLDASYANRLILVEGLSSNQVSTLPDTSTLSPGQIIKIVNLSAYKMTFNTVGGQSIVGNASTSVSTVDLLPGDSLTLISHSSGNYIPSDGSAALKFSQGVFAGSIGASTWQRLPSGLLMQSCKVASVAHGSSATASWPIAFNSIRSFLPGVVGNATNGNPEGVAVAATTTGVTAYNWGASIDYSQGVHVWAWGD